MIRYTITVIHILHPSRYTFYTYWTLWCHVMMFNFKFYIDKKWWQWWQGRPSPWLVRPRQRLLKTVVFVQHCQFYGEGEELWLVDDVGVILITSRQSVLMVVTLLNLSSCFNQSLLGIMMAPDTSLPTFLCWLSSYRDSSPVRVDDVVVVCLFSLVRAHVWPVFPTYSSQLIPNMTQRRPVDGLLSSLLTISNISKAHLVMTKTTPGTFD